MLNTYYTVSPCINLIPTLVTNTRFAFFVHHLHSRTNA